MGYERTERFRRFFPDGDYVGWDEEVEAYFNDRMSNSEKTALGMQSGPDFTKFVAKFVRDLGPLQEFECPKEFRTVKSYKNLASLLELNARLFAVDEELKRLIEELEPGVHQFWPVKITMPRNKVYPIQYYGLRIGQFLPCFDPEQSDPDSFKPWGSAYRARNSAKKTIEGLAISLKATGAGAHLWRDPKLTLPHIFLSDELVSRVGEKGLPLPKHFKMKDA